MEVSPLMWTKNKELVLANLAGMHAGRTLFFVLGRLLPLIQALPQSATAE
jgi:hypothetical protein